MRAADAPAKETARKPAFLQSGVLVRLIQGAFIGLGAILPGVSGGVLCVVFGVYKPIVELLSHPVRAVKKYARLLIPILIGLVVGSIPAAMNFVMNPILSTARDRTRTTRRFAFS